MPRVDAGEPSCGVQRESGFLETGELLSGRYEVVGLLRQSVHANVYRALDRSTRHEVVVKVSSRMRAADADAIPGLDAPADPHALVTHPNIASLSDRGVLPDGRAFAVFEYVAGSTLRAVLEREGRLPRDLALRLMGEVLDALAAVHRHGVVHRDVKPENVMVTCTGAVRHAVLLDFGFAATPDDIAAAPGARPSAELLGTPRYAAPEQLLGAPASPAADVYAWGLTLIECLTGTSPVGGETAREAVARQLDATPIAIPEEYERAPLGSFLAQVTAKDARRRPCDAMQAMARLATVEPSCGRLADEVHVEHAVTRNVTVVSARLVDPDPDDARAVDEFRTAANLLERGGGTILAACGRRVVAAFGLRLESERDAHNALDAAMSLIERLDPKAGRQATWTVGIHCGQITLPAPLVLGDGVETLPGTVFAIASRLDAIARPGRVAVSASLEAVIGDCWALVSVGDVAVEGLDGGVRAFRVRGARTPTRHTDRRIPIVGRVPERNIVHGVWAKVAAGSPKVLMLRGPAGIGKSTIVASARSLVADADWRAAGCTPEHATVPMAPVVDLLRSFGRPAAALARLSGLPAAEALPILATLLGEGIPDGFALPAVTPERLKELTAQVVVRLLLETAGDGPTVLVVEDLHWADASTRDFLGALVAEIARHDQAGVALPLFVMLTGRPDFDPVWLEQVVVIDIDGMERCDAEQMVRAGIDDERRVGEDVVVRLVEASQGNPLFVEQATRLVCQAADGCVAIPDSLEGVLATRVNLLETATLAVARVAAAIGREFEPELLSAAAQVPLRRVWSALDELASEGLVSASSAQPLGTYGFSHALLRDAAYDSLPVAERPAVHRRIARVIERERPEVALRRPAELALHLELAGETDAAVDLWHRSGVQALSNAAYLEACHDLERGERLLGKVPETPERTIRNLGIATALGSAHIMTKGFGAAQSRAEFAKARALCDRLGCEIRLEVLGGIFGAALVTADDEVESIMPRFRELALRTDNPLQAFSGHQVIAVYLCWKGRFEEARVHAGKAVQLYRHQSVHDVAWEYGFGIHSYSYLMMAQFQCGHADQAEATRLELLERAERSGSPHCVAPALGWSTTLTFDCGRYEETLALSSRLAILSREQHLILWEGYAMFARGGALAELGDPAEAVRMIQGGLAIMDAVGVRCGRAYYLAYLSRALIAAGDFHGALAAASEGMDLCSRVWTRFHEPEMFRLHGVALERLGRPQEAAADYCRARDIARRDGGRAMELRALSNLAALTVATGMGSREPIEELTAAVAALGEGLGTVDVRRAQVILESAGVGAPGGAAHG